MLPSILIIRGQKPDEIHISREIWDRIDPHQEALEEWTVENRTSDSFPPIRAMDSLSNELEYFVYLTENGEIKDSTIREYYRRRLLPIFRTAKYVNDWNPDYEDTRALVILDLIEKYHKIIGKMDEYRKEFIWP